jgi:hypothetical protein
MRQIGGVCGNRRQRRRGASIWDMGARELPARQLSTQRPTRIIRLDAYVRVGGPAGE